MITSLGLSGSAWSCYYTSRTKPKAPYRERRSGHVKCSVSNQNWGIHQKLSADSKPSLYHQDHYQINLQDEWLSTKHAQKLREVGNLLIAAEREDSLVDLTLVDAIQRLRIDHHFQEEIEALLGRHYRLSVTGCFYHTRPSLYEVSLSFRLLRQEGYYVAPDVFSKYMDENRRFNLKAEKSDIKALTELYEAAQLSIEGEDILDAAAKFSSQLLTAWTRYLDDRDARIIKHNLRHPYRKSLARFKSMNLMTEFEGINGLGKSLQELSYVENHMAKGIHGQELLQISKWWEDLGLVRELKHARDQPLKWYTWSIACLNDLSFSDERVDLTKTVSFIYLIDDIYDLYGEPEDLHLFTQAVKRWDIAAIQQLPDYMKKCFTALYGITNEAAVNIQKKHGFNPIESLRKTWAGFVQCISHRIKMVCFRL